MVRDEEDADELQCVGRPPRVLPLGLRWRLLISNYAVFFGSLFYAIAVVIGMPFIAGSVWAIWNERMIVLIFPLMFVFIFPLLGLVIALWGIRDGLRKIRLLRQGELCQGTIVTCRFNKSDLPFPEFLRQWQELQKLQPPFFRTLVRIFFRVWSGGLIGFMILGGIGAFLEFRELAMTGGIAFREGNRLTGSTAVVTILGELVAWWAFCLFLLFSGRRGRSILSGQVPPASLDPHPELTCTFEYRLP